MVWLVVDSYVSGSGIFAQARITARAFHSKDAAEEYARRYGGKVLGAPWGD